MNWIDEVNRAQADAASVDALQLAEECVAGKRVLDTDPLSPFGCDPVCVADDRVQWDTEGCGDITK